MLLFNVKQCEVHVVKGDIIHVEADALIAPANVDCDFSGMIDLAIIESIQSDEFHRSIVEAAQRAPLKDGQVISAELAAFYDFLMFRKVLFVVDELKTVLRSVIRPALMAADAEGLRTVTVPLFRTGRCAGVYKGEPNVETAIMEQIIGMRLGLQAPSNKGSLKRVTIVTHPLTNYYELVQRNADARAF